jgi:hypothetical protein
VDFNVVLIIPKFTSDWNNPLLYCGKIKGKKCLSQITKEQVLNIK